MQSKAYSTDHAIRLWPDWGGETAVCIATGPSLTRDQIETVKQASVRTIGINDIGLTEKWIDIWYAADRRFWKHYSNYHSDALKVCAEPQRIWEGIPALRLNVKDEPKAKAYIPGYVLNGGHSGFQALQLAISLGAVRVVLLGFDCKPRGVMTNYFGQKCAALQQRSHYEAWPKCYRDLQIPEGVEVLNATPGSAIDAYPFVSVGDLFPMEQRVSGVPA